MTIYTIGYEGLNTDEFMSLLQQHNIETIVDVRQMPLSRKPGFSKKSLECILDTAGRQYVHIVKLGCPKPIRDRYRIDGDWKRYTTGFLKYLDTQQDAVEELAVLASISNCALLCYEADYNFCHRSMVANAVEQLANLPVQHIQATGIKTMTPTRLQPACA
jgi:uncharacterized protein (DUF488 family)